MGIFDAANLARPMTDQFSTAFLASVAAAAVTTLGICVIRRYEAWGRANANYFASFAAGVLISVSFLHIVPKAISMAADAPAFLLAGYFLMHFLNRFITAHVCDRPESADYAIGLVPMLGIGFHSLLDGAIYSTTFTVDVFTGTLAAIGTILHEFPEGIVTYLLLLRGGFDTKKALLLSLLAAAFTTPLGMLLSFPFISQIDRNILGLLLSLSAGALIYVGATHLLPQAERETRRYSLVSLGGGMVVALGIVLSK